VLSQHVPLKLFLVLNLVVTRLKLFWIVVRHDHPWLSNDRTIPFGINTSRMRLIRRSSRIRLARSHDAARAGCGRLREELDLPDVL
jgi:hypothetical protein